MGDTDGCRRPQKVTERGEGYDRLFGRAHRGARRGIAAPAIGEGVGGEIAGDIVRNAGRGARGARRAARSGLEYGRPRDRLRCLSTAHCAAGGAHIELVQHFRMHHELGLQAHHDVVLLRTVGVVDRRHLGLREGVSERAVDLALGSPSREAASRLTTRSVSSPPGCRSVSTSVTSGTSCRATRSFCDQVRSSFRSSPRRVYWYSELAPRPPPPLPRSCWA